VAEGRYRDGHSLEISRIHALAVGGARDERACQRAYLPAPPLYDGHWYDVAVNICSCQRVNAQGSESKSMKCIVVSVVLLLWPPFVGPQPGSVSMTYL
jgi:hypothetical protein